jgi:uncharacterized protein YdhG (YjbR/CyaY superfamily)
MAANKGRPATVDEYIGRQAPEVQPILSRIRATIREAAPEAEEKLSYGMPGYFLHGPLVFFAANRHHIGLYPRPAGSEEFNQEVARYRGSKGAVHLPLDEPMPYDFIRRIVKVRLEQSRA